MSTINKNITVAEQYYSTQKGPLDSKLTPADSYAELIDLTRIPRSQRYPGLTVTVLGVSGAPNIDYWLVGGTANSCWKIKAGNIVPTKADLLALSSSACTVGLEMVVQVDETNNGQVTKYWVSEINGGNVVWTKKEYSAKVSVDGDDKESQGNYLNGFKQATLSSYLETDAEERENYVWLVREFSGETVLSASIYFGNRKYADITEECQEEKATKIIASLGDLVDENGNWVGFLPIEEHEILGNSGVTTVENALTALEAAIIANADAISNKLDKDVFEQEISGISEEISDVKETLSALTDTVSDISSELEEKTSSIENELELVESALTHEIETRESEGQEIDERFNKIDNKIGDATYEGDNITSAIAALQSKLTITGNDVE